MKRSFPQMAGIVGDAGVMKPGIGETVDIPEHKCDALYKLLNLLPDDAWQREKRREYLQEPGRPLPKGMTFGLTNARATCGRGVWLFGFWRGFAFAMLRLFSCCFTFYLRVWARFVFVFL